MTEQRRVSDGLHAPISLNQDDRELYIVSLDYVYYPITQYSKGLHRPLWESLNQPAASEDGLLQSFKTPICEGMRLSNADFASLFVVSSFTGRFSTAGGHLLCPF